MEEQMYASCNIPVIATEAVKRCVLIFCDNAEKSATIIQLLIIGIGVGTFVGTLIVMIVQYCASIRKINKERTDVLPFFLFLIFNFRHLNNLHLFQKKKLLS
jgi:formate/nitrite transporter FocA (FNT family)